MAKPSMGTWMRRAGKALPTVIILFSLGVARGQEKDKVEDEQWFRQIDTKQFADLERTVQKIYAMVSPSVVRILIPGKGRDELEGVGSGVIVSPSGEVFTCAHFDLAPQTKVFVELADGSRVKATALGHFKKPSKDGL